MTERLKASEVKPLREKLLAEQGCKCCLCHLPLLPNLAVLDHDHSSGRIRGAIHRSCNSVLGKVENGFRYGKDFNPVAFAKGLHEYLTKPQALPFHPTYGRTRRRRTRK